MAMVLGPLPTPGRQNPPEPHVGEWWNGSSEEYCDGVIKRRRTGYRTAKHGLFTCCCLVAQSCLTVTPQTVFHQAPLSMGLPRLQYWSGLPFPPPGDLSDPVMEPVSPELAGKFLPLSHQGTPQAVYMGTYIAGCS